jgi:geranylgeranyl reductase family protein
LEEKYDLVVVGAGPAGSTAACKAAKLGLKVLVLEEHSEAGLPLHCAGKLTVKAFKEFNLPLKCVINGVRGAYFHSPRGITFKVSKPKVESYIIRREMLDAWLAQRAANAGAELRFKSKVRRIVLQSSEILVEGLNFKVKALMVALAEGGCRRLTESLGFKWLPKLKGIQFEVENIDFEAEDFVELFFSQRFFPGFFGWIIPLTSGKARVGLCVGEKQGGLSPRTFLKKALRNHSSLSAKAGKSRITKIYGGVIPIHGPISKPWHPKGIILIGDAAGHVKSTTGGGVFFGLKAGEIAGEAASRFLENRLEGLKFYEKGCRKSFGSELAFTSKVRRIIDGFKDSELDDFFKLIASDEQIIKTVEVHGDTAFQSAVWLPTLSAMFRSAFKNPSRMGTLIRFIPKIIQTFL